MDMTKALIDHFKSSHLNVYSKVCYLLVNRHFWGSELLRLIILMKISYIGKRVYKDRPQMLSDLTGHNLV